MTHQQAIDGLASERYLLNEMSEMERHEFEAHYFDCAECAEDVRLGEMIRREARRAGAVAPPVDVPVQTASEAPRRAKILTRPQWRRPAVAAPWAAAAALAVLASYQSFVTVPALRQGMTSQPIAPVMLRGATRGAAPVLRIAADQRFVTLAVDVMAEPPVATVSYEILDTNRLAVTSGEAPVPSGMPLMLLVPVDELRPAGRFTLVVRSADRSAVFGEYDFDVSY